MKKASKEKISEEDHTTKTIRKGRRKQNERKEEKLMAEFKRYEKVHRFDHVDEVEGILKGECHIFEKIDGANASVWCEIDANRKPWIYGGSRNHVICKIDPAMKETTVFDSLQGFSKYILDDKNLVLFLLAYPFFRLYGEWLVKHTVVYDPKYTRKFHVFDVENRDTNRFLPYLQYRELIQEYEIPFIKPFDVLMNPTMESLEGYLGKTNYGGTPQGEGIVVKNYGFVNQYGREVYAKLVTKEFSEMNKRVFGDNITKEAIEVRIAYTYCTLERVMKIRNKIEAQLNRSSTIEDMGRLLGTIYNDIITEEMWSILKKYRNPTIDFRKLQKEITDLAKNHFMGILRGRSNETDTQTDL
jgi:hypothetical protein